VLLVACSITCNVITTTGAFQLLILMHILSGAEFSSSRPAEQVRNRDGAAEIDLTPEPWPGIRWMMFMTLRAFCEHSVIQFNRSRPTNQIAVFSRVNWFTL